MEAFKQKNLDRENYGNRVLYSMLCVLCSEKYEEVMREIELEALERATPTL